MPIHSPKIECMPLPKQKAMQLKLLKRTLGVAYDKSPFYKKKFSEAGVNPKNLKTLDDIRKFPFTTKYDVLDHNDEFLTKPKNKMLRVFSSSGTTTKGKIFYLDQKDYDEYLKCCIDAFYGIGLQPGKDIVSIMFHLGLTVAGVGIGIMSFQQMGILAIPFGLISDPKLAANYMKQIGSNVIYGATAQVCNFTEELQKMSYNLKKEFNIKKLIIGGSILPARLRQDLKKAWGAEIYETYGTSEAGRTGFECQYHNGFHTFPDYVYFEFLDEKTGEPVKEGKKGEIVFTILRRESMPLIRYRINDIAGFSTKKCQCGRTTLRILGPLARAEERIVFKGFYKLYGHQINGVLHNHKDVSFDWQIVVKDRQSKNIFTLRIETDKGNNKTKKAIENDLVRCCESVNRGIVSGNILRPKVEFIKLGTLERNLLRKIRNRIVDKRKYKFY